MRSNNIPSTKLFHNVQNTLKKYILTGYKSINPKFVIGIEVATVLYKFLGYLPKH